MDKNYRIHTNIINDTILNVDMKQDFDFIEVLSLKLSSVDAYKLHSSNYGVIVGRVLANDAFGIPNAKISLFIERDNDDSTLIESFYPYTYITTNDSDGRRYNLLPDYSEDECYRVVGTFPNKRLVLDDDTQLEIYDKYWKYSTVTNYAGDYMIFGVPTGNQQIHVDIDLSDIGILSQKPTDFIHKGYNLSMFDSPRQFKESTNLDGLAQVFSQNKSVFVYPFWGDNESGLAAITRSDIQIQYKFEPSCVFIGSIVSDNEGNSIGHKCSPSIKTGMNNQLVAGEGNIEMIRKTPDGFVEEFQVQNGESLIDTDGVWCYQIPMNLDYVGTDEYGNIVPTDDVTKGLPTRARVRFRISKNETGDEGFSRHTAKYLVPMNPLFDETSVRPQISEKGSEIEKMYNFGSNTPESCFRDLYWNNVYSVKNFIPKTQVAHRAYSKNYLGLKGSNLVDNQNPIPFNKLRFDLPFVYMVLCILFEIVENIVNILNKVICVVRKLFDLVDGVIKKSKKIFNFITGNLFKKLVNDSKGLGGFVDDIKCIVLGNGIAENDDNKVYVPGCWCKSYDKDKYPKNEYTPETSGSKLIDMVQQNLAKEFNIVKLDFNQDWLNGCLYMPLWYWRKRKKRKFLGITVRRAKNQYCSCDSMYSRLKSYVTCNIIYRNNSLGTDNQNTDEKIVKWHKGPGDGKGNALNNRIFFNRGLIKQVENKDGLNVYYYSALQASNPDGNGEDAKLMNDRRGGFNAIRLLATDIILLGNLNEDNLYGIPQMFTALPSTTANIPPIATISESKSETAVGSNQEFVESEDTGITVTTGMDWGNKGDNGSPKYSNGLFMDLSCTDVKTKAKSCINVERLSEFGVNLDMNYDIEYLRNNNLESDGLPNDGFISKYELDDMENRSMFATMNHIGFVPQSYQYTIGGYTTQVIDENTGYYVPKFKYLYPVDFDGRLQPIMSRYKGGFKLSQYDELDEQYLTFRLGAEKSGNYGRIRHFYFTDGNGYSMPLYNNSFYFYFGINKGNTAIDKFNKLFFSQCFKNEKSFFTAEIDSMGRSYCPQAYKTPSNGYSYISVSSDDIQVPYQYSLYDENDNLIINEMNMSVNNFVIGGYKTESDEIIGCETIHYQNSMEGVFEPNCSGTDSGIKLTNQTYTIELIDRDGKKLTKEVSLKKEKISINYSTVPLGSKFYNTSSTNIEYICNDNNKLYGKIIIDKIYIDGYPVNIGNASCGYSNGKYVITATTDSNDSMFNSQTVKITIDSIDVPETRDCMCDSSNTPSVGRSNYSIAGTNPAHYFKFNSGVIELYIYQPSMFVAVVSLDNPSCDEENVNSFIIKVDNADTFNTYLNGMPLRFILGTNEDNTAMTTANSTAFYKNTHATSPTDDRIKGWFGTFREDTFSFSTAINRTTELNSKVWEDFVDFGDDITEFTAKLRILTFKFNSMFSLSNAVYVTDDGQGMLVYSSTGGPGPILTRSVSPDYADYETHSNYLYQEAEVITINNDFPNIVGSNYVNTATTESGTLFNPYFDKAVGNYFASFTKNGGYTSMTGVDDTIMLSKSPNYTAVNVTNGIKPLGTVEKGAIGTFGKAYDATNTTKPYFRAMTVDRRFDYDMIVLGPIVGASFDIGGHDEWKLARFSGITYNGIEMSYDGDYNLITATTNENSAQPLGTLEYTYRAQGGDSDCVTIYNETPTISRKPYSASINGLDITDCFWSTEHVPSNSGGHLAGNTGYVFKHNSNTGQKYNGYFSIENYPTRRLIDVGSINNTNTYELLHTSCSYSSVAEIEDVTAPKIIMNARPGEESSLVLDFYNPIEFVSPNADNTTYGNATYVFTSGNIYGNFVCVNISMQFKFTNLYPQGEFDVATKMPKIIQVLPNIGNTDGLSYIKTANEDDPTSVPLNTAINNATIYQFTTGDATMPAGVSYDSNEGFKMFGGAILTSDNNDLSNIIFRKNNVMVDSSALHVFTIMVERNYINTADDYLTKHIRTFEFGDLYDIRPLKLEPNSSRSFVEFNPYDNDTDITIETEDESASANATGITLTYIQTVAFDVTMTQNTCSAFKDYNMMSFIFTFKDNTGTIYTINCSDVSFANDKLMLNVRWRQDMGEIGSERWGGRASVVLYAKTPSNFTYKVPFTITGSHAGELPTVPGARTQTNITIS